MTDTNKHFQRRINSDRFGRVKNKLGKETVMKNLVSKIRRSIGFVLVGAVVAGGAHAASRTGASIVTAEDETAACAALASASGVAGTGEVERAAATFVEADAPPPPGALIAAQAAAPAEAAPADAAPADAAPADAAPADAAP